MVLLLQLNGDLPEFFSGHERRLYVMTCRRKTCRRKEGSVKALRGIRITEIAAKDKRKGNAKSELEGDTPISTSDMNLGETLFGTKPSWTSTSANPFSTNPKSAAPSNPFSTPSSSALNNQFAAAHIPVSELAAKPPQRPSETTDFPKTFASALSLNIDPPQFGLPLPPEPWPQESELPPAYPLYYLVDANYEILDKIEDPPIPTQTMDLDEGQGGSNQKEDKDVFESTIDITFQKFADRLAQNPEQVIRYEFKGEPLLYSKHDDVGKLLGSSGKDNVKVTTTSVNGDRIPRCGNCGAGRVFEVQLTPHAIMELEREEISVDGMEWGTIIVGVCERDCQQKGVQNGEIGYVEEWAGVQWEELNERR
jgi:pre-rRNA-processing protein TSR4